MILRHQLKSAIFSFLFNFKIIVFFLNYFKFVQKIVKVIDYFLHYMEVLLLTLAVRYLFSIKFPDDLSSSIAELLTNPSFSNPFVQLLIHMTFIGFIKELITNNTRNVYAYNNSKTINLEYVSDKVDSDFTQYIEHQNKNPHLVNLLCISGHDTLTDTKAYLHNLLNNADNVNLIVNIIVCNYVDDSTKNELSTRQKQLKKQTKIEVDYKNQIIETYNYCKALVDMGVQVNFYVHHNIPEFKIVMIDNIVIVQSYASAIDSSQKTIFVISKSIDHKKNNNSIFESFEKYFENKKKDALKISLHREKDIEIELLKS
jgi:hypothetical protein